ncbi:MAG: porin family protein [Candidatus Margulisbacteria bacterium]|jgi:opacity protein-like surface antigen|nr:porin family protein [Candidatus Margulisiibacteriota bacterium]
MKKALVIAVLFGLVIGAAGAGTLNISGRAGMYNPGSGISSSMMYGVAANYDLTQNLALRGALDTTSYNTPAGTVTYMPATVDLIFSQNIGGILTPYAGAGLGYNSVTAGGTTNSTTGYQAEVGVRFSFSGLSAGVEYRYLVPDASKSTSTSSSNAYIEGGFSQSFNL